MKALKIRLAQRKLDKLMLSMASGQTYIEYVLLKQGV